LGSKSYCVKVVYVTSKIGILRFRKMTIKQIC
jgi:hypothetical protein